jgi:hypothetical protein
MGAVIVPLFAYIFVVAELPYLWRLVTLCVCVLNFLFWIIRFYVYETPKFLVSKGKLTEATRVLEQVAKINGRHGLELGFKLELALEELNPQSQETDYRKLLSSSSDEAASSTEMIAQLKRLFDSKLRYTTIVLLGVWFFSAFAWAGFGMFVPALMERSGVVTSRA